jgi:hypothetical protein
VTTTIDETMRTGESWTIHVPAHMLPPAKLWLNSNDRIHPMDRSARAKPLRQIGAWAARGINGQTPLPHLQRAHIYCYMHFPDKRRRDPGNWYPTAKALVDGMVTDYGLLPDDDMHHLIGPDMRAGIPSKPASITFMIHELV